jgi:hypothetical protein
MIQFHIVSEVRADLHYDSVTVFANGVEVHAAHDYDVTESSNATATVDFILSLVAAGLATVTANQAAMDDHYSLSQMATLA